MRSLAIRDAEGRVIGRVCYREPRSRRSKVAPAATPAQAPTSPLEGCPLAIKRYDVCAPRKYQTSNGEEKTHFWNIGTAFPLKERDGFSIKLWTRILPTDELVLFVHEPKAASTTDGAGSEPPPHDDIPF
jgi:hypothetical protein